MSLISIIVALALVGFALWLVQLLPIDGTVKKIIVGVVIFFCIIWLLQSMGLVGSINTPMIR